MSYLHKLLKHVQQHKTLAAILCIALALRIAQMALPGVLSWDGSVYVGMGKYLYSGGTVGLWELFRPVVWPIILGAFWKMGIDPYIAGRVLATMCSLVFAVLAYALAERIKKGAGNIAAIFAAMLPILFQYSTIPMVDIPSATVALGALYIYTGKGKYKALIAGLCVGFAFLWRFPQGLMLAVLGIAILIDLKGQIGDRRVWQKVIKEGLLLGLGFALVVVPYLITNNIFYGNILAPIIAGNEIISTLLAIYNKGVLFYFGEICRQSALLIFAVVPFIWIKKIAHNKALSTTMIAIVVYLGYFTYQPHKEARYLIACLPYIIVLAAVGVVYVAERIKVRTMVLVVLLLCVGIITNIVQLTHGDADSKDRTRYDAYFSQVPFGARVISSGPFPVRFGDVKIVRAMYIDWRDATEAYNTYRNQAEYIAIDSCIFDASCDPGDNSCSIGREELLAKLDTREGHVFSAVTGRSCALDIYKFTK